MMGMDGKDVKAGAFTKICFSGEVFIGRTVIIRFWMQVIANHGSNGVICTMAVWPGSMPTHRDLGIRP